METSDRKDFARWLIAMGELHNRSMSDSLARLYFDVLKDFGFKAIENAFSQHLRDPERGQFFPKPADLIRFLEPPKLSTGDLAEVEWENVVKQISSVGPWRRPDLKPHVLEIIRALGGWQCLCEMEYKDLTWRRKEFIQLFETKNIQQERLEALQNNSSNRLETLQ